MKIHKTIKVDGSFPTRELGDLLNQGWEIIDKTVIKERYIHYVLEYIERDSDVGKSSDKATAPTD